MPVIYIYIYIHIYIYGADQVITALTDVLALNVTYSSAGTVWLQICTCYTLVFGYQWFRITCINEIVIQNGWRDLENSCSTFEYQDRHGRMCIWYKMRCSNNTQQTGIDANLITWYAVRFSFSVHRIKYTIIISFIYWHACFNIFYVLKVMKT